jgi:hypothetical protein
LNRQLPGLPVAAIYAIRVNEVLTAGGRIRQMFIAHKPCRRTDRLAIAEHLFGRAHTFPEYGYLLQGKG